MENSQQSREVSIFAQPQAVGSHYQRTTPPTDQGAEAMQTSHIVPSDQVDSLGHVQDNIVPDVVLPQAVPFLDVMAQVAIIRSLYASGLSIMPIAEGKKTPHYICLGSDHKHKLLTNRATDDEVEKWIAAGVTSWAIAGGAVSGNVVTLDFDEKHYAGLYDLWYASLSDEQKKVVDTCAKNSTRNNGTHLRYRTETPQPTTKLASRFERNESTQKDEVVTTAETRGEGSYALIPPSTGYTMLQGDLAHLPLVTDGMHQSLVAALRSFNEVPEVPAGSCEWTPGDVVGDRPGDRLNAKMSWEDILMPHGWVRESHNQWRRPGKKAGQGISASTDYNGVPLLRVFSSAAAPFEAHQSYPKFTAFALLNHGGDFKAAARAAAALYPDPEEQHPVSDNVAPSKADASATTDPTQLPAATRLVELVTSNPENVLFLDQYDTTYVRFPVGDHYEIWPCDSSEFKHWLSDTFYRVTDGKVPSATHIASALGVLSGRARANGVRYSLHNRIAEHDGAIWYDLCDAQWRAVRVDRAGWAVVSDPPILFRRQTHQAAQAEPVTGGDLREVLKFVNVRGAEQELLFLAHLIVSFAPGFPHAILYVHGPQGSAKSSLLEILNLLLDPSHIGAMSLSKNLEDVKHVLNVYSACAAFDNVSHIPEETSDLLCRAVTGAGFSKRKLYTNGEDYVCRVKANIAINGINPMAVKPDLLERSVLLELERPDPSARRNAKELQEMFMAARPRIMGAIFTTVSKALATKDAGITASRYRMADYTALCGVVADVIGCSANDYMAAYQSNVDEQNETVIESSLVARLVIAFMGKHYEDRWAGTSTVLLDELRSLHGGWSDGDVLPKNPAALSRKLRELKPTLEAVGWRVATSKGAQRSVVISKITSPVVSVGQQHA